MKLDMLYDKDFLLELDKDRNKTIYARITALQFNETPIECIEGRVTQGSINIDGSSAVRRSCSLTIASQNFDYSNYYWGMNTKFKLEIGLQNMVDENYPDVIWFPQGIYLITSFNISNSTSGLTISISGKDKMALLNGEISGSLESSVDFGQIQEEKNGVWTIRKIPLPEIIRNMVHVYAGEPYWNIVINDLDTYGVELLEYRYDIPMYLYRKENSNIYDNALIENNTSVFYIYNEETNSFEEKRLAEIPNDHLDLLVDSLTGVIEPKLVYDSPSPDGNAYIFAKVSFGQTAGYRQTDLVYPGDLIANVGESLTSVLDKIKNMLVEFEYFYNLSGQFVFQKKQSFVNTLWTPQKESATEQMAVIQGMISSSAKAYTFSGGELISSFNNSPNISNMKNDYSVWGERESATGVKIPIHLRYAIDKKPIYYKQIIIDSEDDIQAIEKYNKKYNTSIAANSKEIIYTSESCDWREIIYQMALDYYRYNFLDNFELLLIKANTLEDGTCYYPTGQTGYEQYYIDLQGFWRDLYYPNLNDNKTVLEDELDGITNESRSDEEGNKFYQKNKISILKDEIKLLTDELNSEAGKDYTDEEINNMYIAVNEKKSELNIAQNKLIVLENREQVLKSKISDLEELADSYYTSEEEYPYWNKNVFQAPELLNFWFDFLDTEGELQQFNIKSVGDRSKGINDTTINSIYFRETPTVIFTSDITESNQLTGYRYIQIPEGNIDSMFSISAQGKSAKNRLDELIYQHGYCIESVTIQSIPVYYLEPNTRIYVYDNSSNIDGDYIINKMSIPLSYNGTMSINATKAAETLL